MAEVDPNGRAYEHAMSFVSASDRYRQQFIEKWQEVISNFIVEGAQVFNFGGETSPYQRSKVYRSPKNRIYLRDPETHKLVMTYAAKLMRTVMGDKEGKFVEAEPVGYEDVPKAQAATRLLRYAFALPGHFRTFAEAIIDMLLIGTSVVEDYWKYEERDILVRSVSSQAGVETSGSSRKRVVTYDDPCLRVLDVMDFYPDPARYRIEEMGGCAKRFKMNAAEAKRMVDNGLYDAKQVELASSTAGGTPNEWPRQTFRAGLDQPAIRQSVTAFKDMIGFEYWGDIPEDADITVDGENVTRGVITVLNQKVVRVQNWPLADDKLPFHTFIINPVQGRFYGISPAEVVRFDQSFADAVKVLLAEAIIRQVHPPIAVDDASEVDLSALRAWKADTIVAVRGGPQSVGTLQYGANIPAGFQLLSGLKQEIQGGSGALGGIQGEAGPDREAASVGLQRVQMALDRPELAAMILESECLPSIARSLLKRYQQFLETTDDLKKRVGEMPEPFWIGDMLVDFDVRFVGSRNAMSKAEKLQAFQALVTFAQAVPAAQVYLPHPDVMQMIVGEWLGLPEAAAQVGDPNQMKQNLAMTALMGMAGQQAGGPQNNGVPNAGPVPGLPPSQAAGGVGGLP